MDWEAKEKERRKKIEEERQKLLAMSDAEAEKLPTPDRYQRMRYQREIEAAEWLADLRRKLPAPQPEREFKTKRKTMKSNVVYFGNKNWSD